MGPTSFASQALHGDFSLGLVYPTIKHHCSWQLEAASSSVGRSSVFCRFGGGSHMCNKKSLIICVVALAKTVWEVKGRGGTDLEILDMRSSCEF